jgi:hypothetical protein
MLIQYWSHEFYPDVMFQLLEHTPRLARLTIHICSNQRFFPGLVGMFGQVVWPNLQGVCIRNEKMFNTSPLADRMPTVQLACPNASIHLKFKKGKKVNSRLFYGVNLPSQCDRVCYKCIGE